MITGFACGCFDMFHIGHLNLIRRAREQCDKLVVGLNSDEFMYSYKHKYPIIPAKDRKEMLKACRYVDDVIIKDISDSCFSLWQKYHYDKLFIGSDSRGSRQYAELDILLRAVNAEVVILPYTEEISSSILRKRLNERINEITPPPPTDTQEYPYISCVNEVYSTT
ncbi:MAG: adenylyltransferase/cytidyltransferase family protein [Spirochaetaceae bacterium]|jgi:glycerol-3-phosphate cytidylyltransferase|nr:adenylyltransferase/cytidyltransferase family protein [Spirochaetaceae bacterium]